MTEEIQVRTVRVELLRAGPAHNQLLSPLTPYLGVCDDAEAGVVHVPFEQHTFERRMRAMRKDAASGDEGLRPAAKDHLPELRDLGIAMGRLLGAVPRLPGALSADPSGRPTLVRLSLTLSASELAGLPFELAKVPVSHDATSEQWLSLQGRVQVVITRRTRNVPAAQPLWLQSPRILFIAASDDDEDVPYAPHLEALCKAILPFVVPSDRHRVQRLERDTEHPGPGSRWVLGNRLTVLCRPRLHTVMQECSRTRYTHVHVLAHGRQDDRHGDHGYGLELDPQDGIISGERLADVLSVMVRGRQHRPQVVTLATCNSGDVGNVVHPGASLAHALHQAGIPLVVASQVPLGFDASVLMAEMFYGGLLWGEHPWVLMHRIRTALHGRLQPDDHDWASLVVYEALPAEIDTLLEEGQFRQCERALNVAQVARPKVWPDMRPLEAAINRLVAHGGRYAMEACALRGELRMLFARAMFDDRHAAARDGGLLAAVMKSRWRLEEARADFDQAVTGFVVNPGQGLNAPFRALTAKQLLGVVLEQPPDEGEWHMGMRWCRITYQDSASGEHRAWAQGCAALLELLYIAYPKENASPTSQLRRAEARIKGMVQERSLANEVIHWVRKQLENIANWWSSPDFRARALAAEGAAAPPAPYPDELPRMVTALQAFLDGVAPFDAARTDDRGTSHDDDDRQKQTLQPEPEAADADDETEAPPPARPRRARALAKPAAASAPAPAPAPSSADADTVFDIEMLPVAQGDCLWIEWGRRSGERRRMLIDCGTEASFDEALGPRIEALPKAERRFELFVMSHIDGDHIGGGLALLKQAKALGVSFGDIWFNGRRHLEPKRMLGAAQGDAFSALLVDGGWPWNLWTGGKSVVCREGQPLPVCQLPGGMKLTLVSPLPRTLVQLAGTWDKELGRPTDKRLLAGRRLETSKDLRALAAKPFKPDGSRPNGSSIALLAEYAGLRVLLAADAYADVLAGALRGLMPPGQSRLPLHAFKLPHHGSRGNIDTTLMSLVDCRHYLVSTSGAVFCHPDREALARVVLGSDHPKTLWFNYPVPEKEREYHALWQDPAFQRQWNFRAVYPEGPGGLKFSVTSAG